MTESEKPITPAMLGAVEARIGMPLPPEYRAFLLRHNGGRPDPARFPFLENGRPTASSVNWFLAVHDGPHDNLLKYWDTYDGRIPSGLLPIAHDPGGNLVCISCAGKDKGAVYFWDHEQEGSDEATMIVSPAFNRFLSSLFG